MKQEDMHFFSYTSVQLVSGISYSRPCSWIFREEFREFVALWTEMIAELAVLKTLAARDHSLVEIGDAQGLPGGGAMSCFVIHEKSNIGKLGVAGLVGTEN